MSDDMDAILAEAAGVFRYVEGERPQDRAHGYLRRHRVNRGYDDTAMQRAVEDMAWRAYHVGLSEGMGRDEEPTDDDVATPPWYAGDRVGASEALDSAAAQPTVCERPEKAHYWWALAFKYVWRLWSKSDPKGDCAKARDCLARLEGGDGVALTARAARECAGRVRHLGGSVRADAFGVAWALAPLGGGREQWAALADALDRPMARAARRMAGPARALAEEMYVASEAWEGGVPAATVRGWAEELRGLVDGL